MIKTVGAIIFMIVVAGVLSIIILYAVSLFFANGGVENKCFEKASHKGLINNSKIEYKLANSNVVFKVEDWGDAYYGLWTPESPELGELCEIKMEHSDSTDGVRVAIGYVDNDNFVELSTLLVNVYAYAQVDKADPYRVDRVIQSMVDGYSVNEEAGVSIVGYKYYKIDNESQRNLTGKYKLIVVDEGTEIGFPALVSQDGGLTWSVNR